MSQQENSDQRLWFSPETLEILRLNTHMSESTWAKVIAADPSGWRALLQASPPSTSSGFEVNQT